MYNKGQIAQSYLPFVIFTRVCSNSRLFLFVLLVILASATLLAIRAPAGAGGAVRTADTLFSS